MFYTVFSISALLLQGAAAKCHLTSKHEQTTSLLAVLHTTPRTSEGSAVCPQSTIPRAPVISRCSTVLRASIRVISGCICHPTHLNLDFQHSLLLHSHLSPSWTRAEGSEWGQPQCVQAAPNLETGRAEIWQDTKVSCSRRGCAM